MSRKIFLIVIATVFWGVSVASAALYDPSIHFYHFFHFVVRADVDGNPYTVRYGFNMRNSSGSAVAVDNLSVRVTESGGAPVTYPASYSSYKESFPLENGTTEFIDQMYYWINLPYNGSRNYKVELLDHNNNVIQTHNSMTIPGPGDINPYDGFDINSLWYRKVAGGTEFRWTPLTSKNHDVYRLFITNWEGSVGYDILRDLTYDQNRIVIGDDLLGAKDTWYVEFNVRDQNPNSGDDNPIWLRQYSGGITFNSDVSLSSTFEWGDEGWRVYASDPLDVNSFQWNSTGGNPGGYISAVDGEQGVTWWFRSPISWAGDWTQYIDGSIQWDILLKNAPDLVYFQNAEIVIDAPDEGNYLTGEVNVTPILNQWVNFYIVLNPENFTQVGTRDFNDIIANVDSILIRGEFITGPDSEGLDNVFVSPSTAMVEKIVWQSDRAGNFDIYIMNPDGSNKVQLTNNTADDQSASISPDGTKIAFESNRSGESEIWIMDVDGVTKTKLTNGGGLRPVWSLDGTKIYYNGPDPYEVSVINADGTNYQYIGLLGRLSSISPDGNRLVYWPQATGDPHSYNIFTAATDGTDIINLSAIASLSGYEAPSGKNVWGSNGKILFQAQEPSWTNTTDYDIWYVIQDGSESGPILDEDNQNNSSPGWSPDELKIVFCSKRISGDYNIWTMDSDGTNLQQLTNDLSNDTSPHWGIVKISSCQGDFPPVDGDVDGADLAAYISGSAGISLNDFVAQFGRVNCF